VTVRFKCVEVKEMTLSIKKVNKIRKKAGKEGKKKTWAIGRFAD
jgi:hypothetical protein